MKRLILILCTFVCFVMSVLPVSASTSDLGLPPYPIEPSAAYPYFTLLIDTTNNTYAVYVTTEPWTIDLDYGGNKMVIPNGNGLSYYKTTSSNYWEPNYGGKEHNFVGDQHLYLKRDFVYANYLVYTDEGDLYLDTTSCDGSSCPATDLNHDNICDDCGAVLTMSLRSKLLDYAHAVIDNALTIFDGAQYWLVTIGEPASEYNIYVSSSPFTYDKNTKALTSNAVVQRTTVTTDSNGTFKGGTSWVAKQPYTVLDNGKAIDSSHVIDNFFPIPLWMEMETLTQGEVVEVVAETNQTIMILVVCGVSLIALLSVLLLFGKRSLLFRK